MAGLGDGSAGDVGAYIVPCADGLCADGGGPLVAHDPQYAADGSVRWTIDRPQPSGPGWWQGTLAWSHRTGTVGRIHLPGGLGWDVLGANSNEDPALLAAGAFPSVHGDTTHLTRERARYAFGAAQEASQLPSDTTARRVLWSGTIDGWWTDVIAVTSLSGAHVVTVATATPQADGTPAEERRLTEVLPAGPLERVGLAWKQAVLPGVAGLVGPVGAVSAQVVSADGGRHPVALVDGAGSADVVDPVRADFLDASGRVLATVPVRTQDTDGLTPALP
ncbi:MAG TPA: hypothetical protein VFP72_17415 [Kineosporiaceae bacterium]|nr:hypothetical protein [Kineosporiaceae bacterium]